MAQWTALAIATMAVTTCAVDPAFGVVTIDYSDQWWVPSESGWGAAVVQQADTLVVDLLVYGADGKPAWYVASALLKPNAAPGHTVFSGDLYATTGPWFGGPFNPALVAERKAGTLTFDATGVNSASIAYTVDGVAVSKNVVRMTWSGEDLSGNYSAVWNFGCPFGNGSLWGWRFTGMSIAHSADNAVHIQGEIWGIFEPFEMRGSYSQDGRLGRITAKLSAPGDEAITISDIERTTVGFTARLSVDVPYGLGTCDVGAGRLVAVRAP
jgi:hypothetical protein